jgi:hypothetical protein
MNRKTFLPLIVIVILTLGCASAADIEIQPTQDAAIQVADSGQAANVVAEQAPETQASDPAPDQPAEPVSSTSASQTSDVQNDSAALTYAIVDTAQGQCYGENQAVDCPQEGSDYYGQDAQYSGNQPNYVDNGDGTVTDLVTGLMWQQDPGGKVTYQQAVSGAETLTQGGYDDWRLPTIKELYSLILFDGTDIGFNATQAIPFVDTDYFMFEYGNEYGGRVIDSQFFSSTEYVSDTMNGSFTVFGVNFADGRIKGYGQGGNHQQFVRYVRGNSEYGVNNYADNGDGTVTDSATGLTWMQSDSGSGMDWADALSYCENLDLAGSSDWRLPDAKELQSIVDYTRSPDTTSSAAIDPLFSATSITSETGQADYPWYWTSTTHADANGGGRSAAYITFGEATGYMNRWIDVHGAGAQRSDPKSGDPANFPTGRGPQGDGIRINNYVRCVSGGDVTTDPDGIPETRTAVAVEASSGTTSQGSGPGGQPPTGGPPEGGPPEGGPPGGGPPGGQTPP